MRSNDLKFANIVARFPDRVDPGYYVDIPVGWEDIVISLDLELAKIDPDYLILQVKEKFGQLRFYFSHAHNEACGGMRSDDVIRGCLMYMAVDHAVDLSAKTCERCPEPGILRKAHSGWLHTACDEHAPLQR